MDSQASGFHRHVIQPVTEGLGISGDAIQNLLLGAAWARQFCPWQTTTSGMGLYNLTPDWHRKLWDDFLAFRPDLASHVRGLASQHGFLESPHQELIGNAPYATAVAACALLRHQNQWPRIATPVRLTRCWFNSTGSDPGDWSTYIGAYEWVLSHGSDQDRRNHDRRFVAA